MRQNLPRGSNIGAACLLAAAWQLAGGQPAAAQQAAPAAPPPAPAAAPAAPASNAMAAPALSGPLVANPDPMHLDVAPFFGPIYVTGAASFMLMGQTSPVLGVDHAVRPDITNAQAVLQTTSGLFQFFLEPGVYSFPTVGVPYTRMANTVDNTFGGLPVAWGKFQFADNFSIQGGKLPTLIGYEAPFTFQNMNVQRGLLWNQEPVVSRGAQANLTTGPVAWALSVNDGFYSGQYNWLSGSATWTIDPANSVAITGGGALGRNATVSPSTPEFQNNSTIVEASYTFNRAPWTITPYLQFTHVAADPGLPIPILKDASTVGGALLASYALTDKVALAGRAEYIASSGGALAPNLLGYGPGSSAMSLTLTPTFQAGVYFLRGEASLTQLFGIAPGLGFGSGNQKTQARFLVETGVVF